MDLKAFLGLPTRPSNRLHTEHVAVDVADQSAGGLIGCITCGVELP